MYKTHALRAVASSGSGSVPRSTSSTRLQPTFVRPPTTPVARIGRRKNGDDTDKTPPQFWVLNTWTANKRLNAGNIELRYSPEEIQQGKAGYIGTFGYRFDDPGAGYKPPISDEDMFRMFYCAETVTGAACETLAGERGLMYAPASRQAISDEPGIGDLHETWCESRAAGFTLISRRLLFVDLTTNDTLRYLRSLTRVQESCKTYLIRDIVLPTLQGDNRCLTQDVARAIYEDTGGKIPSEIDTAIGSGVVAGIKYLSKHSDMQTEMECWALFDTRLGPDLNSLTLQPCVALSLDPSSLYGADIRAAADYMNLSISYP